MEARRYDTKFNLSQILHNPQMLKSSRGKQEQNFVSADLPRARAIKRCKKQSIARVSRAERINRTVDSTRLIRASPTNPPYVANKSEWNDLQAGTGRQNRY